MKQIVECVPNFSEGRRSEVIDQIVAAIESVEGVRVLDRSSDADHNRTVITFVGPPETIGDAAFAAIARAAELIDMDQQQGEHPRMGATDVVPFVPISGVTMEDCVEIARQLGARVGAELGIPVYLYEAAATRPDRVNLGELRPQSHQYEQKKADVGRVEKWTPDFGPARVGKTGVTAIGARAPLIAYNVYLTTGDVKIAEKIARAVRHSNGGSFRQGTRIYGERQGAGQHEPDRLYPNPHLPGSGDDPARGGPLWREHRKQRTGGDDPPASVA